MNFFTSLEKSLEEGGIVPLEHLELANLLQYYKLYKALGAYIIDNSNSSHQAVREGYLQSFDGFIKSFQLM